MSKEIKKKKSVNINWQDIEELAAIMCGKSGDDERSDIEDAFYEKFDASLESFEKVMETLWPMLDFGISPLTDTPFIGLSDRVNERAGLWIVHKDISPQFIAGIIQWLGGDKLKPGDKGMLREITNKGEIEYKITITKP